MDLSQLFNYGVPTALLLLVLRWLKPRADRLIDSHLKLVASLTEHLPKQTELLEAIRDNGCGHPPPAETPLAIAIRQGETP
jgi:hypothetical protein